jgi:hypothetical protein
MHCCANFCTAFDGRLSSPCSPGMIAESHARRHPYEPEVRRQARPGSLLCIGLPVTEKDQQLR